MVILIGKHKELENILSEDNPDPWIEMSAYSFLFVDTNFKSLDFSIQVDVTEEIRKEERDREDKKGERALGNIRW